MNSIYIEVIKTLLPTGAFLFAIWKYLDQRRRELRLQSFKEFHEVLNLVVGRTKEGVIVTEVHQIAAIYQLREFKIFKEHFLPILDYFLTKISEEDSEFGKAVRAVRSSFE